MGCAKAEAICAEWNGRHAPGTAVEVTDDVGTPSIVRTRSEAWVVGCKPVVLLYGRTGCYLLERVRPVVAEVGL